MTELRPTKEQVAAIISAISIFIENGVNDSSHKAMLSAWKLSTFNVSHGTSSYQSTGWTRRN